MRYIYGFDGLRAFSVTLVILSHVGVVAAVENPAWQEFFSVFNAAFGVRVFFTLSGFLITMKLLVEHRETGQTNLSKFFISRVLRIMPVYFLSVAAMYVLCRLGLAAYHHSFYYAASFLYNFVPITSDVNYFSHLWSLSVEEQFYLAWPLLFVAFAARRKWLVAVSAVIVAVCWLRLHLGYGAAEITHYPNRWTIPAIHSIMIGCIAAILIYTFHEIADRTLKHALMLAASLALICLPLYTGWSATQEICVSIGAAGLISWVYLNQESVIPAALDWGPIGYLGKISYGLYIWQGICTGNGSYREGYFWPLPISGGLLLALLITPISYHFFERPIMRLRQRLGATSKYQN